MTVTLANLIDEARSMLFSGAQQEVNRCNGAVASGDTNIALHYSVGSAQIQGAIIAIDLELIRVWETDGNTKLTVVERGVNSSVAAAHSDGAMVEVIPKFSQFRVSQAINEDLDDLCSPYNGLFAVPLGTVDLTYNPAVRGYDLTGTTPANILSIQEIRYKTPGPLKDWPEVRKWHTTREMSSSDFASTMALIVSSGEGGGGYPGLPLHVRYRQRFTHFVNLTDDAQSVAQLPAFANDLPPIGAAMRLMSPREIKRNFDEAQPDAKLQEDVPPGSILKSYAGLQLLRQQRIAACQAQLTQMYGIPLRMN